MLPKHSSLSGEYGAWFKDPLLAAAYPARPAYPSDAIDVLLGLIVDQPSRVLDVGCGTGELARRLAPSVSHVDAVDFSAAMLELARQLPGGSAQNIRWIESSLEDASLEAPYALVCAGESLHWMDWYVVLPKLARVLTLNGVLVVLGRDFDMPLGMAEVVNPLVSMYSPVKDYRPHALVDELVLRELFVVRGRRVCGPEPWSPTIEEYLEARHSQRGLSRTHMGPSAVEAFDAAMRSALAEFVDRDGRLSLDVRAHVTWGKPT